MGGMKGAPGMTGRGLSARRKTVTRRRLSQPSRITRPKERRGRPTRVRVWLMSVGREGSSRPYPIVQLYCTAARLSSGYCHTNFAFAFSPSPTHRPRFKCGRWHPRAHDLLSRVRGSTWPKEDSPPRPQSRCCNHLRPRSESEREKGHKPRHVELSAAIACFFLALAYSAQSQWSDS